MKGSKKATTKMIDRGRILIANGLEEESCLTRSKRSKMVSSITVREGAVIWALTD